MPNGTVHRGLTKALLISNVPLYFYVEPVTCTGILIGVTLSLWVNCDNDIAINRLGIYKWLGFDLYNEIISHRAGLHKKSWKNFQWKDWWKVFFYSHFPITGTFLRFLIVLYAPLLILLLFSMWKLWMAWLIWGVFVGLCESDALHSGADVVWSGLKKLFPWLKRFDDNGYRPYKRKKIVGKFMGRV